MLYYIIFYISWIYLYLVELYLDELLQISNWNHVFEFQSYPILLIERRSFDSGITAAHYSLKNLRESVSGGFPWDAVSRFCKTSEHRLISANVAFKGIPKECPQRKAKKPNESSSELLPK